MSEHRRGTRCSVCIFCGRCFVDGEAEQVDAVSHATNWADAFKEMDDGSAGAPPPTPGAPGECDAVTGATPGVATACKELGLDDMANLAGKLGIKPPGQA